MRLFISVELPVDIKQKISLFQYELKKLNIVKGNFIAAKNLHLTLKFIGEVDELKLATIKNKLINIFENLNAVTIGIAGCAGVFKGKNIKIIWLKIDKCDKLLKYIHTQIDNSLCEIGIAVDNKYTNHITLVRIKQVFDKDALAKFLNSAKEKEFGCFEFNKISLMQSILSESKPNYKEIFTINLNHER